MLYKILFVILVIRYVIWMFFQMHLKWVINFTNIDFSTWAGYCIYSHLLFGFHWLFRWSTKLLTLFRGVNATMMFLFYGTLGIQFSVPLIHSIRDFHFLIYSSIVFQVYNPSMTFNGRNMNIILHKFSSKHVLEAPITPINSI